MSDIINVHNILYSYQDGYRAINNLSFTVKSGEKLGIVGANGAGKSTLLKIIVGLCNLKSGSIVINGKFLNKENINDIRKEIGFVFQESDNQLFMNTVYEDVVFGLRNMNLSEDIIRDRANNVFRELGIENLENKDIYKLSGGEKKIVSIAGIIIMYPQIILMDEPTSSLDPRSRRNVIDMIKSRRETMIIASHDLDMILDCCNRVIVMSNGSITCEGIPYHILGSREIMDKNGLEVAPSFANSPRP